MSFSLSSTNSNRAETVKLLGFAFFITRRFLGMNVWCGARAVGMGSNALMLAEFMLAPKFFFCLVRWRNEHFAGAMKAIKAFPSRR